VKALVLLSGGLDSTVSLAWARECHDVVAAVSFDYGAKHNECELACARQTASQTGIRHVEIPLRFIGEYFRSALLQGGGAIPHDDYDAENVKSTVVPFRNAIMLSVAVGLAESLDANAVVIAAHGGDHALYPDCRPEFYEAFAAASRLGTDTKIEILRPFIAMDKAAIVAEGARLKVDFANTWSCYEGGVRHCGKCATCRERRQAFRDTGIADPAS